MVFCPFYLAFLCLAISRDGALCCLIRAMLAGLATHWLHEGKRKDRLESRSSLPGRLWVTPERVGTHLAGSDTPTSLFHRALTTSVHGSHRHLDSKGSEYNDCALGATVLRDQWHTLGGQ